MRKTKKVIVSLAIASMATMIPLNALADGVIPTRLGGATAEQTAALIADQTGWTDTAVLASSASYGMVDALTASPLATFLKAPILLTEARNVLNADTKAELNKLKVKTVYVTSGTAVISQAVLDELTGMGIKVVPLGGSDRFQTSVNIAKQMIALGAPVSKAAVAFGWMNQDALSISAIASAQTEPILLTEKDTIPTSVKAFLTENTGVQTTDVIGGIGVISDAVRAQFPSPTRVFGTTAYDTNLAVLKAFDSVLKYDHVFIANGETAIDALTGAPLAAKYNAGIVLTNGAVNEGTKYVSSKLSANSVVTALGGTSVVSDVVRAGVAPVNPVAPVDPVVPVVPGGGGSGSSSSGGNHNSGVTYKYVETITDLNAALADPNITEITFTHDITMDITVSRSLTINFGAYALTGNVLFQHDLTGTSSLTGTAVKSIKGNLTVDTKNASFENHVVVSDKVNINNVKVGTWTEYANGNTLTISDHDGAIISIVGSPGSITVNANNGNSGNLTINVNQGAIVSSITCNAPVEITVASGATVNDINVAAGAGGSTITNNGTMGTVTSDAPINLVANVAPSAIIAGASGSIEITGTHASSVQTVLVSAINVTSATTGSAIADTVVNGGTLQMLAEVTPANATNKAVTWSVATLSDGTAVIDASTGYLQATGVGTVTVTATNAASGVTGTKVITIAAAQTQAQTAAQVAAGITTIAAPVQGVANLTLPTVPTGFTVAIKTSSNIGVITTSGAITIPSVDTTVALVLEVTRTSDSTTASSISINVVVPAAQAQTAAQVAAGITEIQWDASNLTLPTVPTGFTVAIKTSSNPGVITTSGAITIPSVDTTVALVLEVTRISDATTASSISIDVIIRAARADSLTISGGVSSLWIPTSGSTTSDDFTVTVMDQYGRVMPLERVTWSLINSYPGVSVDPSTGAITLQNSAWQGTFLLVARSNSDTTLMRAIEITLNLEAADTVAPTLSGVTAGAVVIGDDVAATSNEAGFLYLVPQATVTTPGAIDAAGLAANGIKAAATAGVSANLSTANFTTAGTYVVYAIDAAGNVSTGSAITVSTAVTAPDTVTGVSVIDGADGYTLVTSPTVGQVIRANITLSNGTTIGSYPVNTDAVYKWYYQDSPDTVLGTTASYTVTSDNMGKKISVDVSVNGYTGTSTWTATNNVCAPDTVTGVSVIDGADGYTLVTSPTVGQVIRANITLSNGTT
ncbi:cell wall-binding repeat-containing protein, partial [Desulfosporosinus sp. Sb-LF]|uniref:cell wall-binding repeat-containing protein n=1 Tax=Desulfosporosinus sp. Sb-LF TaxID=2560027 RepID=UPI00107F7479